MSLHYPFVLAAAVLLTAVAVVAYVLLQRRRTAALAAAGLAGSGSPRRAALRRHLPYALLLAALPLLLVGLARPEATVTVPRIAGTVVLVFDASNSMKADDLKPNRLAAAQEAATSFVEDQPDSVDVGVVVFGDQALMTQEPTDDRNLALAAIKRVGGTGGTSLSQAILASLSTITGKPVSLPAEGSAAPAPDLGYWPSATIVLFSDGENTSGTDVQGAADLAATAGVRIQTVGVGTARGATVEVDGYQLATALDEPQLTSIAATTGGSYHRAEDADGLAETTRSIDLRLTSKEEPLELTAPVAAVALVLLVAGALLMTRWHGRIV
ncbi:VWA domain-containing protein [Cryptosporangium aurantiacum]|uniref:Ca-activated chloride channel family protein n=1 Tax=Cryptosporangium aurantiacum TaxID=134849 RepID=A0A1M7TX52_9ACTN|nr:VWA domain-containing protein [Cryptosporangium aurantiacum]SHN75311.1 Ca-activated chloride channel family protein [Cryptosporangium aurantiacum]